jgi:hypothetical protein
MMAREATANGFRGRCVGKLGSDQPIFALRACAHHNAPHKVLTPGTDPASGRRNCAR